VRTEGYVGVCAALAFETPLVIQPAATESRHIRVLVADGVLTHREINRALTP
jgi:hypothetical protein